MSNQKIINIAVIAHVDAGKSTLVDALLKQGGAFRENQEVVAQVMDSNDQERERGITIYSKNCSIQYKDIKINIVDTPGHADFSSEVERIMKTVDTVILLVDSSEGVMPQTRFVLSKALDLGLKPILFINKIDKKDQRALEIRNWKNLEGKIKENQTITVVRNDQTTKQAKVQKLMIYKGLNKVAVDEATAGEIITFSGIDDISIGDTICDLNDIKPRPPIIIEEPTMSMNFLVNTSPFAGKVGKFVTSRNIKERLEQELKVTEYAGTVINKLNQRVKLMIDMDSDGIRDKITYLIPLRALIGFRGEFTNDTHGEGIMVNHLMDLNHTKVKLNHLTLLNNLEERGILFVAPQTEIYEGMIVGQHSRDNDLDVNPTRLRN
ncbi:hypothetical protein FQA39_LY12817 [Lamprigera yunnana]|nr:hypothetical protein FQA39_LY12817 [Lamprigera yunnana]